ncbi:hypothetical protein PR048_024767 [Dryococelus australis]|uniref:Uncharacterized protein n=1 Tax=Dryococelus australis TaxID=614101 RepID=A0ABQ9GPH9_9NEOP|nr:hypothetical protein PR048_024767 [Dryococelus australis]
MVQTWERSTCDAVKKFEIRDVLRRPRGGSSRRPRIREMPCDAGQLATLARGRQGGAAACQGRATGRNQATGGRLAAAVAGRRDAITQPPPSLPHGRANSDGTSQPSRCPPGCTVRHWISSQAGCRSLLRPGTATNPRYHPYPFSLHHLLPRPNQPSPSQQLCCVNSLQGKLSKNGRFEGVSGRDGTLRKLEGKSRDKGAELKEDEARHTDINTDVRTSSPSIPHMAHLWFTVGCQAGQKLANIWHAPGTIDGREVTPLTSRSLPIDGPGDWTQSTLEYVLNSLVFSTATLDVVVLSISTSCHTNLESAHSLSQSIQRLPCQPSFVMARPRSEQLSAPLTYVVALAHDVRALFQMFSESECDCVRAYAEACSSQISRQTLQLPSAGLAHHNVICSTESILVHITSTPVTFPDWFVRVRAFHAEHRWMDVMAGGRYFTSAALEISVRLPLLPSCSKETLCFWVTHGSTGDPEMPRLRVSQAYANPVGRCPLFLGSHPPAHPDAAVHKTGTVHTLHARKPRVPFEDNILMPQSTRGAAVDELLACSPPTKANRD